MKQTAGIVLLMALMGASLEAQRPMTPNDYQPPPSPSTAEQPAQPSGPPAREPKKAKDPYAGQKLGPLGMFPLTLVWGQWLAGPPVAGAVSDGATLFVATTNKHVMALGLATNGTTLWTADDLATTAPLALDGGRLFVVLDQEIVALDAKTGKPVWRIPAGGSVSAPLAVRSGWVIVALDTGELRALRGATGELVWQTKFDAQVTTPPVIIGDRLYVAPQDKNLVALDILTGHELWHQEFDAFVTAIAAQDDRVFIGTNRMFFGLDHGGDVRWKWRIGSEVVGQPIVDGSNVYVAFADNTLRAFDAGKGAMRWRAPLAYRPVVGPVRAHSTIVLAQIAPFLHGYDAKEGKPAGDFQLSVSDRTLIVGAPIFVPGPTFFEDTLLVLVAQGYLTAQRSTGPGLLTPFADPGVVCPPLSLPGAEPPPATATTTAAPPKS